MKSGETLSTIARKLRVSRADLAEANYLSVKSRVRPGQELIIPRAPATLLASRTDVRRRRPSRRAPSPSGSRGRRSPDAGADAWRENRPVTYKVKRGDTLFSIAQLFDTTVAKLSLNQPRSSHIASAIA